MIGPLPGFAPVQPSAGAGLSVAGPALATTAAPEGASFTAALAAAATRTVGLLENAQDLSASALQGEVETREVVDAVMSAEQSLQAAIAIRDKIVQSYLEVSRMAI